jgi:hypothetical protein
VQILLWLVPPFLCAVAAMTWVAWVSRERRDEVDQDEQLRLLGAALEREPRHGRTPPATERERSTGVAVRRVGRE